MDSLNTSYFLPYRYKKIGWVLFILSTGGYLGLVLGVEIFSLIPLTDFVMTAAYLLPMGTTVSLALLISSREKEEDEMIRLIRLKSFQYGIYLAVAMFFFLFLTERISMMTGFIDLNIEGVWVVPIYMFNRLDTITAIMLYIFIIYHFNLYRLRNHEE